MAARQHQMKGAQADESSHPVLLAQREKKRGSALELSRMTNSIARVFGIRIDVERLDDAECRRLLELHAQAAHPQDSWQEAGRSHYGLVSQLDVQERAEWRRLVGKAAGGIDLDLIAEDIEEQKRMRELARLAMAPGPLHMFSPAGAAVLPSRVLEDVLRQRLLAIDLAVLTVFVATFASGKLHPSVEERNYASWAESGDALVFRGDWIRLLPAWGEALGAGGVDAVTFVREQILGRLTGAGWLEVSHPAANETVIRLGARFGEEERRAVGLGPRRS